MAARAPKPDPIPALVDELGDLDKELGPFQGKISRVETLRKAIRDHYGAEAPGEERQAEGQRFVVHVGARGMQRSVDVKRLAQILGPRKFAAIATVALKQLAGALTVEQEAEVVTSERTGPRPLKILEKGKAT